MDDYRPNDYAPWTPEEWAEASRMWEDGVRLAEIGKALGRSAMAVRTKIGRNGGHPRVALWTPEMDAKLLDLWEKGKSASHIASSLNMNVTRSAVCGRLFRLRVRGVKARKRAPAETKPIRPKRIRASRPANILKPGSAKNATTIAFPMPKAPTGPGIPFLDRAIGQCAYITSGDVSIFDKRVCGEAVADSGKSYCDYHYRLCYQPLKKGTRSEQKASKTLLVCGYAGTAPSALCAD